MKVAAILAIFAVAMLAGCSDTPQTSNGPWHGFDLDAVDPSWRNVTLEPQTFLEMDFAIRQGDTLEFQWFVEDKKEIPFQIHYHTDDFQDFTVVEYDANKDDTSFTAETSNMYSMLWKNPNDTPRPVWVRVQGEISAATYRL